MRHIHHQPSRVDYRLRPPRSIRYALAAGSAAVALGVGYRTRTPVNATIANSLVGVGSALLAPALAVKGLVQLLQAARNRLRDSVIEPMNWRGDERVLDVGTGSGILLFACAKHLHTGKATGIDIYDPNAGGSTEENFWRNARGEGVADRVELLNVDARAMTFPDASFNLIVSSLAMHHMGGPQDRRRATEEMVRVVKPGGTIAICDFSMVLGECEQAMQRGGMINIRRDQYMGIFSILSAEKPETTA